MDIYLCYALADYDVVEKKFLLEFYDFRDAYFDVKEFETFDELYDFFNNKLLDLLQVKLNDVLFVKSNAYARKVGSFDSGCIEDECFSE